MLTDNNKWNLCLLSQQRRLLWSTFFWCRTQSKYLKNMHFLSRHHLMNLGCLGTHTFRGTLDTFEHKNQPRGLWGQWLHVNRADWNKRPEVSTCNKPLTIFSVSRHHHPFKCFHYFPHLKEIWYPGDGPWSTAIPCGQHYLFMPLNGNNTIYQKVSRDADTIPWSRCLNVWPIISVRVCIEAAPVWLGW